MRISSLMLFAVAVSSVALLACNDQHVGRQCFIQRDTTSTTASEEGSPIVVNPQALECPSRLCLHASQAGTTLDLCTTECGSDDDCEGETSQSAGWCTQGFRCVWPVEVGPLCCKRMCMCKDLAPSIARPASCEPTAANKTVCQNL
jgi:hypothetical protein